jgi:hypothetical protein
MNPELDRLVSMVTDVNLISLNRALAIIRGIDPLCLQAARMHLQQKRILSQIQTLKEAL